jgi:DNA repair exonuclease SbcCD ATPase subunit
MANDNDLNLQGVFDAGSQKMDLTDLEKQGFKKVKVLDQKAMEEFIRKAVDRVVSTQTAEEKERIVAESRKELDRLMKEHRAVKSHAQLLESDKNELVEHLEAMQRELELKSELEEATLHKKFLEGTASMQKQVEEVKRRADAAAAELEKMRVENARLAATLEAEREKVTSLKEDEPRLAAALKENQDLNRQNARFQTELEGAGKRIHELEGSFERERSRLREAEHARTEMVEQVLKLQSKLPDVAKSARELEALRAQLAKAEDLVRDGAREHGALKSRVAELEARLEEAQAGIRKSGAEAARLEGENGPLRKDVDHLRAGVAALEASLAEERTRTETATSEALDLRVKIDAAEARTREKQGALDVAESRLKEKQAALDRAHAEVKALERGLNEDRAKGQTYFEESASLRKRLDAVEARNWDNQTLLDKANSEAAALRKALEEERAKAKAGADEADAQSKAREAQLRSRLSDADRLEIERVGLLQELTELRSQLVGLDELRREYAEALAALQEAKDDVAASRAEIATLEKEQEAQREKVVIVSSDLEEIEQRHQSEQQELGALREKSQSLQEEVIRTRLDLSEAREALQSLQGILQREQEVAREARNDATLTQARLHEVSATAARLEEQARRLVDENATLQSRAQGADLTTAAASALDHRLEAVERLMESARQQSGIARESAADSRKASEEIRKSILLQNRPKTKPGAARLQGGVALDGHALLQEFFRRIRLKERLQKHVPVREKDGQPHPSELLADVVAALIAGDRRPGKEKGAHLEILGPARGPDVADLRQFLSRVSPQAGHAVSRVHDALRHNLFSMPERPGRVLLDVGSVDLPRQYRPLVAFEPESKEFWHGELRTTSDKDTQGIVPFLKECVRKVPGGFPRSRVRFRLDPRYFSEDVVRFLNSRGCSYVMEAPSLAGIRAAAQKAKYRELSGGWEAGEFQQRIHPIRKTLGRFVVVRHRLSRKGHPAKPMFRDKTWEYCVYVVDGKISPWRAHQAYESRAASQAESASLLTDFTKSALLGRRRRQHGALFPLYLMASDLVQWFRRKALPMEERGRGLDSLRGELLRLPTLQERMGAPRLPMLRKTDKNRKVFERVARKIKRLRPVRPFTFRK